MAQNNLKMAANELKMALNELKTDAQCCFSNFHSSFVTTPLALQ